MTNVDISPLSIVDAEAALGDLTAHLLEAVEEGASVGFVAPLDRTRALLYWRAVLEEMRRGSVILVGARLASGGPVVGSVQLALAPQPNGAHRAEVRRLLVAGSARRRGVGRALMLGLEAAARDIGRTLLVLNTREGDPPEKLYLSLGYVRVGTIPDYARNPDGTMNTTTLMYRQL